MIITLSALTEPNLPFLLTGKTARFLSTLMVLSQRFISGLMVRKLVTARAAGRRRNLILRSILRKIRIF